MADNGGDAACWLDAVCDRCGALLDRVEHHRCRAPARAPTGAEPTGPSNAD